MRVLAIIVLLLFVAAGVTVGALNAELAGYDFGFFRFDWPKGAALLGALVVGWLLGGLTAWLGVGLAARRGRREARRGGDKRPASRP